MPTSPPIIPTLPPGPSSTSPAAFDAAADAHVAALPGFVSATNAVGSNVFANAVEAASNATTASTAASTATTAATTALNSPATQATTATAITIATGSLPIALAQTGKAFAVGQWVSINDTAAPSTRWLAGGITAFNSGTGAMAVDVAFTMGSGSGTSWAVNPASPVIGNASNLTSGTIPAARFPATLPALSGANLTSLDAAQLFGNVDAGRLTSVPGGSLTGAVDAGLLSGNVTQARIATALNAGGIAPIYACRAWVNFNGTGVVSVNPGASGNVASITDNGTGDYTINFITNMPDTNFCVVSTGSNDVGDTSYRNTTNQNRSTLTTSSCRIFAHGVNSATQIKEDAGNINVAVFR